MPINRLHFEDGYPLDLKRDPDIQMKEAVFKFLDSVKALIPGLYVLTPAWWTKNTHKHILRVDEDDTALYMLIPKDADVGMIEPETESFIPGGRNVRIPGDQQMVTLAGPIKNSSRLGIHEVIYHSKNQKIYFKRAGNSDTIK